MYVEAVDSKLWGTYFWLVIGHFYYLGIVLVEVITIGKNCRYLISCLFYLRPEIAGYIKSLDSAGGRYRFVRLFEAQVGIGSNI